MEFSKTKVEHHFLLGGYVLDYFGSNETCPVLGCSFYKSGFNLASYREVIVRSKFS